MRHRMKGRRLGRSTKHRRALGSNLVGALFEYGRITTTVPKAKDHPDLWEVTIIDKVTHQSRTVRAVLIKEKKFGDKGEELGATEE